MSSLNAKSNAAAALDKLEDLGNQAAKFEKQITGLKEDVDTLRREKAVPQYPPGVNPGNVYPQHQKLTGGISEGYSILRAARVKLGQMSREDAKYEWDVHEKLKALYQSMGWVQDYNSLLIPSGTRYLPAFTSESERWVGELKQKMAWGGVEVDPNEVEWFRRKANPAYRTKDVSTLVDTQGGVMVGFPTLMELIDMQRNEEVFSRAGATEQGLPANGRMQYPKLTSPTTAFWVGEGATITESTPGTGYLDLQAKKLAVLVDLNNEILRYANPATESMVRGDMAKVGALKVDVAMLEGTGGTQIKGLITYPSASTWTTGTDLLIAYTVTSNLFQINDAAEMEALMPDTAGEPTAWLMRRQLFAKIRNRRFAAGASATDTGGGYLVNFDRLLSERIPLQIDGTPVVRSTQISNTRGAGTQTYVILGYFPDWIIARFGMMEFLASNVGDTQMTNDQTRLRAIQTVDAGPRHPSSFVFADAITIA